MNNIINLQIWQLALAYIFVIILMIIVKIRKIPREKEIIISSFRMTIQLTLVGYILIFIFKNPSPFLTILVMIIMEIFSIINIIQRSKLKLSKKLKRSVAISMVFGTLISLIYFLLVVIQISPWYKPQYFIPIAGMLIGNSMTGISLGVNRLIDGMNTKRNLIEGALMLGATPKVASKPIINDSFDSAILPTLNSMLGMGIVFLPGMMTGQILSGVSPTTAISYQIAIMLGILGCVSLTTTIFIEIAYKTFFNEKDQLEY